jgi:hypothetical protein
MELVEALERLRLQFVVVGLLLFCISLWLLYVDLEKLGPIKEMRMQERALIMKSLENYSCTPLERGCFGGACMRADALANLSFNQASQ